MFNGKEVEDWDEDEGRTEAWRVKRYSYLDLTNNHSENGDPYPTKTIHYSGRRWTETRRVSTCRRGWWGRVWWRAPGQSIWSRACARPPHAQAYSALWYRGYTGRMHARLPLDFCVSAVPTTNLSLILSPLSLVTLSCNNLLLARWWRICMLAVCLGHYQACAHHTTMFVTDQWIVSTSCMFVETMCATCYKSRGTFHSSHYPLIWCYVVDWFHVWIKWSL